MSSRSRRRWARLLWQALVACAALFFALPLIALVTRVSPVTVAEEMTSYEARTAIAVSLAAVAAALTLIVVFGTPAAHALARRDTRAPRTLEALFDLPLVLPPAVAGIALLAAFGRGGLVGDALAGSGLQIPFTRVAVVLALVFVAGPLYVRQAQAAFAATDRAVLEAAKTSGAGVLTNFWRVELPLARGGIAAGLALSGARALGEFGATIMFAGSVVGVTQTITLAIYGSLDGRLEASFALATVLLLMTLSLSLLARSIGNRSPDPVTS
ncbi:MAG: ABC transporter permease subunit [Solirubrobacterales bacterium]